MCFEFPQPSLTITLNRSREKSYNNKWFYYITFCIRCLHLCLIKTFLSKWIAKYLIWKFNSWLSNKKNVYWFVYSLAEWRLLENCGGSPTPFLYTRVSRQKRCVLAHGSESCSLSVAWQSFGDQSTPISRLQICIRPHDRSEQSWLPHSWSER